MLPDMRASLPFKKKREKAVPGDGLHAFSRHIPILSVIGPETLVKVRLYCGNIDA